MSHAVTITRTTTSTTNTSTLILNTGYLKTLPGLLKLAQLIIGAVCVGIAAYYYKHYAYRVTGSPDLFFLLMTVTFLIGTFCLLASCLVSLSTGGIISKTIYELIYHSVATILLLASSLSLLIATSDHKYPYNTYDGYMAASVLGLVNTILYCVSAIFAQRSYRGI